MLCSLAGGLTGIVLAAAAVFPFTTLIETSLKLPYLAPPVGKLLLLGVLTLAATAAVGSMASARSARHLAKADPGKVLREN